MFSEYPDRWPGLGLLLLRSAAGSVLVVQGITCYQAGQNFGLIFLAMVVVTVVSGVLLLLGMLTRSVTALAALVTLGFMLSWFSGPRAGLFETRSTAVLVLVIAAAVATVGPGAFSVDARLFGRREIIIPDKSENNRA